MVVTSGSQRIPTVCDYVQRYIDHKLIKLHEGRVVLQILKGDYGIRANWYATSGRTDTIHRVIDVVCEFPCGLAESCSPEPPTESIVVVENYPSRHQNNVKVPTEEADI